MIKIPTILAIICALAFAVTYYSTKYSMGLGVLLAPLISIAAISLANYVFEQE